MKWQIFILIFSVLGTILSLINFNKIKKYLNIYSEIFGIIAIVYFIVMLTSYFFGYEIKLIVVLITILGLIRSVLVVSLSSYFLIDKMNFPISQFLFNNKKDFAIRKYILSILKYILIVLSLAILTIALSGNKIIHIENLNTITILYTIINSFLIGFTEETLIRLFLFGMLFYFLKNLKYGLVISIVLSSLFWSLDHFPTELNIYKLIFLFFFGIILGIIMYKKGIEACIIVHSIYDVIAFLLLGNIR